MFRRQAIFSLQPSATAAHRPPSTGRQSAGVLLLAAVAVLAQAMDMAVGVHVAAQHVAISVNPLSHLSFALGGSTGSAGVKLAITIAAAVLFVELARNGRTRLAHTFLILSACMGLGGFLAKVL